MLRKKIYSISSQLVQLILTFGLTLNCKPNITPICKSQKSIPKLPIKYFEPVERLTSAKNSIIKIVKYINRIPLIC